MNGDPVQAVPNLGYHFHQWSDGRTDNPRTDTNVSANISVTASFQEDCGISITFSGPADETIDLTAAPDQTLNISQHEIMTVSVTGAFDSYAWHLDGTRDELETEPDYVVYAPDLSIAVHTLTVMVTRYGVPYSKQLRFRVAF